MGHPCQSGHRCTCHSAGPSNRTTTTLLIAALVAPSLAIPAPAPVPTALPFLYPTLALERRVTDAGQAPDDPSEGFAPEHIQLSDLRRAGLPYKFVYDPTAAVGSDVVAGANVDMRESGAWVVEDAWQLHGKRFGPLSATATADITDDPLPTPTESVATASTTTRLSPSPSLFAIESSLPTGWADDAYRRSGMYAIPLVVSFSLVIALMIGSLIGALAIRRDRSRSRRRKKRVVGDDDSVAREKVVRTSLAARLTRALRKNKKPHPRSPLPEPQVEIEPTDDVEVGERATEQQRDHHEQSELESRIKTWARRSASWRVQARVGMRRRIARGKKRVAADNAPAEEVIREDLEGEEQVEREAEPRSRAATPVEPQTERTSHDQTREPTLPAPTVPTYSSASSAAGPSTPRDGNLNSPDINDSHADAAPSDEPAYDDPGLGDGLPPAYRRGETRAEVRRGKMPMREDASEAEVPVRREEPQPEPEARRVWTELDAYAYGSAPGGVCMGEGVGEEAVTAHVATDDKRVLERLHSMRGAPEDSETGEGAEAPREEDVFEGEVQGLVEQGVGSGSTSLPAPPSKTGAGPVARYDETDLSLPRYLDRAGPSSPSDPLIPSAPPNECELVPSAPPAEDQDLTPSAPPLEMAWVPPLDGPSSPPTCAPSAPSADITNKMPSAPPLDDDLVPSAPPLEDHDDTPASSLPPLSTPLPEHPSSFPLLPQERD